MPCLLFLFVCFFIKNEPGTGRRISLAARDRVWDLTHATWPITGLQEEKGVLGHPDAAAGNRGRLLANGR